jgi:hypothetical protein
LAYFIDAYMWELNVKDWWPKLALGKGRERKALASIIMPISMKFGRSKMLECFVIMPTPVNIIIGKIKDEERTWSVTREKLLNNVIPGE